MNDQLDPCECGADEWVPIDDCDERGPSTTWVCAACGAERQPDTRTEAQVWYDMTAHIRARQ